MKKYLYENYFIAKLSVPNDDKVKWNQLQPLFSFHELGLDLCMITCDVCLECTDRQTDHQNKSPFLNLGEIFSDYLATFI